MWYISLKNRELLMYDFAIIGSGLGGLICAYILSKEGKKVCVVEQHFKAGGSLQTFVRDGRTFDTGVHYIGGLEKGQNLYNYFKYLKIMDGLKIRKLDENAFDRISFNGNGKEYPLAMGYDNFVEQLSFHFPKEREGIRKYIEFTKNMVSAFPLYNLSTKAAEIPEEFFFQKNAKEVIESFTDDPVLQNVLSGNNPLYAGVAEKTPIHVHALINDNFIKSSWRMVDGGAQIADLLIRNIKKNGVEIKTNSKVVKLVAEKKELKYIETQNGERIHASNFISTIHPADMLDMLEGDSINPSYREKIYSINDTVGVFGLYINLKENSFEYRNSNYYCYSEESAWTSEWKKSYMFITPAISKSEKYADSAIALSYMDINEVAKWKDTKYLKRGSDYEEFKQIRAEILLDQISKKFPGFRSHIEKVYTSTPLTFRDYVGARNGALYGVLRDCNEPNKSFISPKTRVKNLYLSGQNIILHGILGVTIGSILTCGSIRGFDYLLGKIKDEL
jgi:all-trans-retinol 13,14-reductase